MREFPQQLTFFTGDFPAEVSPSAWQVTRKDKTITDIYGRTFRDWSGKLNRLGSSLKTFLASCLSRQMTFAGTWSVKATTSGFGILKLRLSAHLTEGKEYFLWRTPDAHCDRGAQSAGRFAQSQKQGSPLTLNDQVAHLLPTPTAHDGKSNASPAELNRHSVTLSRIAGGSLNPEWVEWLMGLPLGWTETD